MQLARTQVWRLQASRLASTSTAVSPRPYSEVPGPKPLPLLGNAWRFLPVVGTFQGNNITRMCQELHSKYGDIVKISDVPGRHDMVILFNPDDFEKVYRNEGAWPEHFQLSSIEYFRMKVRPDFFEGNQGIGNENGENWQRARSVVNPPMMQPRVAKQYVGKIDQVAIDFVKRMRDLRDSNQEMPADFKNDLHKWALESISLVALDTRLGCLDPNISKDSDPQKMIDAVKSMFEGSFELDMKIPIWKLVSTPTLRDFVRQSNIFLEVSLKYVELARARMSESTPEEEQSVLQRILQRDPSTKRAVIMAMDMMLAGIDTTSHSTATALYYLASNPESQERLYTELRQLMPRDPEEPITAETLDSMKYLKACIKESIRLSPIAVGVARILKKEIVLDNYTIPPNVDIMMFNSTLCRMSKHYPEPDRFIPERWLRTAGEQQHKAHPYVYLPFGHGPRQCVGFRFANMEMETLVARVVRNFRLEWHHGEMEFVSRMFHMPASPLRFRVIERTEV